MAQLTRSKHFLLRFVATGWNVAIASIATGALATFYTALVI